MSITIPLTLIEGATSLPLLRPLNRVPKPFGHEWALLPPSYSLRREIKALYAAVLRTFCLNPESIRSWCRWEPQRESARRSQTAFAAAGESAVGVAAKAHREPAAFGANRSVGTTQIGLSKPTRHWGKRAGGAAALGGAAAILAWLAYERPMPQHAPVLESKGAADRVVDSKRASAHTPASPMAAAAVATSNAPKPNTLSRDRANTRADTSATVENSPSITTARVAERKQPVSVASANAASAQQAAASAQNHAGKANAHRPSNTTARVEPSASSSQNRRALSYAETESNEARDELRAANRLSREHHRAAQAALEIAQPGSVASAARHAASSAARVSAAGAYSPFTPPPLGIDEYASVTTSAGTHLRGIESAPVRSTAPAESAGSGEWMNHMTHRRVTDVPDQFSR
ncbi:hypothetical protein [Paraburkholderia sp.]|uniref:hypothetical protein n=1 Tax=Paraburkholderia sp. TaxID=1926495 RepID=UPI0023879329|nr:hypothetical protein [Paraburkholderia sp.]MDE1183561.1 hypothetical protein [Paraburkholderia sp.]